MRSNPTLKTAANNCLSWESDFTIRQQIPAGKSPLFGASASPCFPICYLLSTLHKEKSCTHSGKDHKVGRFENGVKMHRQRKMQSIKPGMGGGGWKREKIRKKEKLVFGVRGVELRGEAVWVRLTSKLSELLEAVAQHKEGECYNAKAATVSLFVSHTHQHGRCISLHSHRTNQTQYCENQTLKLPQDAWSLMLHERQLKRPLVNMLSGCFCFFLHSKSDLWWEQRCWLWRAIRAP